ncbi:hypothetical protein D3C85_1022180 [compost metagenome]
MTHDKSDGAVRLFIVDQDCLLMVGRGDGHRAQRAVTEMRVEAFILGLIGNFSSFIHTETATDKYRHITSHSHRRCQVIGERTSGKPLPILGILVIGGGLQRPICDTVRAFAGQVGFAPCPSSIKRRLPTQHPNLDPFPGFDHQQLTDARRTAVTDEEHRRLKTPTDDIDGFSGFRDSQMHGLEGFFTIDQWLIGSHRWRVFGVLHVPGRGAGYLLGVLQCDRGNDVGFSHEVFPSWSLIGLITAAYRAR